MWLGGVRRVVRLLDNQETIMNDFKASVPANLRSGGGYDMVCCAFVGLISPGLEAVACQYLDSTTQSEKELTFVGLVRWLIDDSAMLEAS